MNNKAIVLAAALLFAAPAAHAADAPPVIDLTTNTPATKDVVPPKLLYNAYDPSIVGSTGEEYGVAILTYIVGTEGDVTDVKLVRPTDFPNVNDAAVAASLGRHYAPATRGGQPVAARVATLIRFGADANSNTMPDMPSLTPEAVQKLDCRHGTHHIAVAACTALLDKHDDRVRDALLMLRARAYESLGQYQQAIADYDALIEMHDKAAVFYRARGFLHERLNQPELAIADYDRAIERRPDDQAAHFDRGVAYLALMKRDSARSDLHWTSRCPGRRRTVETFPSYMMNGDHIVIPAGSWAPHLSLDPTPSSPFDPNRGQRPALVPCPPPDVGQPDALGEFNLGSPDAPRLYAARCELRAIEGKDLEGALDDCNKALVFNPRSPRALSGRALVYYRNKDATNAMKDVQLALAGDPALPGALFLRGVLRTDVNDYAGAHDDFLAARIADRDIAGVFVPYGVAP